MFTKPQSLSILVLAAMLALPACDRDDGELDAAHALEVSGDPFGAAAAYDAIVATAPGSKNGSAAAEAAMLVRLAIAEQLVADGAPLFDLPDDCKVVEITGVEAIENGTRIDLDLDCGGRETATSGRAISFDKIWDLSPVTGTLVEEGECVFRSHDNPFGDWAVAVEADECERERKKRVDALVRAVGDQASGAFSCDCRIGEATFEIARGEPMWKTGPPPILTEDLPAGTQQQLEELQEKSN